LCNFALVICQAAWKTHLLDTANSTATTQLLSRCQVVAVVVVVPVVAATVTVSAWLAAGTLSQHHFSSPEKKAEKKQGHCLSAQWDTLGNCMLQFFIQNLYM